ncbi:MAG: MerR family transcriptional regulator [Sphingomonas bacterium]|nr:MerR family transcriptional regulator [Sphingomonas bacterium]
MATREKSPDAFRTIGELSAELGVAQHILRYWESKFPQLRPLQRAGNRRYYRPADVALVHRIHGLLNNQGYTVRGVQQVLAAKAAGEAEPALSVPAPVAPAPVAATPAPRESGIAVERLVGLRDRLVAALAE